MQYLDKGEKVALVLLDQSAAFDVINHDILLWRLTQRFGVVGSALSWLASYLAHRSYSVMLGSCISAPQRTYVGVPQGSVLGPLLFTMFTTPMYDLISHHHINTHFYADDVQVYINMSDDNSSLTCLENSIQEIHRWMHANKLKLNANKTEVLFIHARSSTQTDVTVTIENSPISSVESVRDLGVILDSSMSMKQFVNQKCKSVSFNLAKIRRIQRFLTFTTTNTLLHAYDFSHLEYCLTLLGGCNQYLIDKLQRLLNRAARLLTHCPLRVHITPTLINLGWLPIKQRIQFKDLYLFLKPYTV